MQAAFVDIGLERAAFLHVEDAIRPEDFSALVPGEEGEPPENGNGSARGSRRRRVTRSTPIREVLKEGQEVLVQVSKEPISTKGARATSHISLPGRHVVYMPTASSIGISRRIGSEKERQRLKKLLEEIKPQTGGFIVRTVAEGLSDDQIRQDVDYLTNLWADICRKREKARAPSLVYHDLDLVLRAARDLFTKEVDKFVLDDPAAYQRLSSFIAKFMPERRHDLQLYEGDEPIFDAYGIEEEIARALAKKVHLPSGGYLVIDQAEALTAIDVNTGRFVGSGSVEETILKTNIEAVSEVAYQLRFRNLGGLIIIDFIDMERPRNRERVYRALVEALRHDKARTTTVRISELGLVEMTRKRTRESLERTLHEACFYCEGTGQLLSRAAVAQEIFRQIRREKDRLEGYTIVVNAHPAVVDHLEREDKDSVAEAQRRYIRNIVLKPRPDYHLEQFDIQGK
jgi:ribonuclease G